MAHKPCIGIVLSLIASCGLMPQSTQAAQCKGVLSCPLTGLSDLGDYCCYSADSLQTAFCCNFSDYVANRSGLSIGAIIGITIGVMLGVLLLCALLGCCYRCCCDGSRTNRFTHTRVKVTPK